MSRSLSFAQLGSGLFLALALVVTAAPAAVSQTTTGSIRGYVKDAAGAPLGGAAIEARNEQSGVSRNAPSQADGSYVLPGLVPGAYTVTARHIGHTSQGRRVAVEIGASLLVDFALQAGAVEVAGVTVQAGAPVVEMRTSEVATNVTQQQIQALPTASRNFLDLAVLAPGVQVSEDRVNEVGMRTFSAGGGSPNQVNVFIDGASLKNDLTQGGVAGQDASRGNPFPRNAIQEYRIITQNFKAEYQKASSAVITATTKSGTRVWSGNVLLGYQNKNLMPLDTLQTAAKHLADSIGVATGKPSTFTKPDYTRSLLGLSVGGPIQKDRLFFFGSYEGNYQNRSNLVNFIPPSGFAALDTVNLSKYNGNFTSPFRETLLFGKLTDNLTPHSTAELSVSTRHETDVRDFGLNNAAYQGAVNLRQDVTTGTLRYNYFAGPWLDEAAIIFDRFRRNFSPNGPGVAGRLFHYSGQDARLGSSASIQDFTQRRMGFRNDLTYTGLAQHEFKGGVTVDLAHYDIKKRNDETPLFEYTDIIRPACWCRDTTGEHFNYRSPYQLTYGTGIPGITTNNNQIGAYIQDDWSPTHRLTLNLGIRWDFESHMLNTDYVTPKAVVDTLTRYRDSLPKPLLDLSRYISTGSNRKPFYGAFQPRVGFSYALDDENRTTILGGVGIYYDRSIFDFSVDEIQKLTHPTYRVRFADPDSSAIAHNGPGEVTWNNSYLTADTVALNTLVHTSGQPEAFLLDNNMKPPKSTQWSLGVRHVLGSMVAAVTYQGQRGTDMFTYNWANIGLDTAGRCCTSFNISAHGFANLIYSTEDGKTWYDAVSLELDRPYRQSSDNVGWGGGIVYTYAKRSIAGVDNLGDLTGSFPGGFPRAAGIPKHADNGGNDERQRIVANWIVDLPYVAGVQFSGLLTLGSGPRLDVGCPSRFCGPATYINGGFTPTPRTSVIPGGWAYQRVDLRLRKDFPEFSGTRLGVAVDVFNVFNFQNYGCYDTGYKSPTYGRPGCLVSDPRRAQLGAEYNF
jgi:hypothetical protein